MAAVQGRLKLPIVAATLLWLVAGVASAAAYGTCAEHDHYSASAEHEAQSGDHSHHTAAAQTPDEHAGAPSSDDAACTCGAFCCFATQNAEGVEAITIAFSADANSPRSIAIPPGVDPVPTALIPHYLPPSIGPPAA